jgi:hypothetical protein
LLLIAAAGPAAARPGRPAPHSWYSFAPYVDMTAAPPQLRAFRSAGGVHDVSLGFVTAEGGNKCTPSWGGFSAYPASGSTAYELAQIKSFRHGGAVIPSFGGAAGSELATVCGSVATLRHAYGQVLNAYHADHADFDIEGADVSNFAAARRRAAALAALQRAARRAGRPLRISLTLPVNPTGLDGDALKVVRETIAGGVSISLVNGMAMDYGDGAAPDPAGKMGAYAIEVAGSLHKQLHARFHSLGSAALDSMVGITAMIGINDVSDELFTTSDATTLRNFARGRHLGMLSFWQLDRDKQCSTATSAAQDDCSGISQRPWAFSRLLNRG